VWYGCRRRIGLAPGPVRRRAGPDRQRSCSLVSQEAAGAAENKSTGARKAAGDPLLTRRAAAAPAHVYGKCGREREEDGKQNADAFVASSIPSCCLLVRFRTCTACPSARERTAARRTTSGRGAATAGFFANCTYVARGQVCRWRNCSKDVSSRIVRT
jgi:hypothetical protein